MGEFFLDVLLRKTSKGCHFLGTRIEKSIKSKYKNYLYIHSGHCATFFIHTQLFYLRLKYPEWVKKNYLFWIDGRTDKLDHRGGLDPKKNATKQTSSAKMLTVMEGLTDKGYHRGGFVTKNF